MQQFGILIQENAFENVLWNFGHFVLGGKYIDSFKPDDWVLCHLNVNSGTRRFHSLQPSNMF